MRTRLNLLSILLVVMICLSVVSPAWSASRRPRRKNVAVKEEQPLPPQPAPPPTPLTLAQMPATPPQVSYQNGLLTIVAQNSTLGDILRAVHQQTGANVDVPSNATERVVTHLGPAPARDVLASLLNGSHFNYVMLGSDADPNALDRLMLMPKTAADSAPATQAAAAPPPPENPGNSAQVFGTDSANDEFSDDASNTVDNDDQSFQDQQDDEQAGQPVQPPVPPNDNQPLTPGQNQPNVKTPQQMLLELQQRQLQLQQQRQQQGYPQGAPQGFPIPPQQQQQPPQ